MLYRNWLVKLYLFVLIALPLYHWAHRFYFALNDMKLGLPRKPLAALCYGGVVVGSTVALWGFFSLCLAGGNISIWPPKNWPVGGPCWGGCCLFLRSIRPI